jgi:hypothetical protein
MKTLLTPSRVLALSALVSAPVLAAATPAPALIVKDVSFRGSGCTPDDSLKLHASSHRLDIQYNGMNARADLSDAFQAKKCKVEFTLVPPDDAHQIVIAPLTFYGNASVGAGDEAAVSIAYTIDAHADGGDVLRIGADGVETEPAFDDVFDVSREFQAVVTDADGDMGECGKPVVLEASLRIEAVKGTANAQPVTVTVDGASSGVALQVASVPCRQLVVPADTGTPHRP